MYDIEIKHLRLVKVISETGNLTRSAALLNISQPALSRQLKDIEERLGTDLFERTKKRMIPTKTGEELNRTAGIVLGELNRVEHEVSKKLHGETGELKLGVHCVLCYKWLPAMLKHYSELYPKVDISIGNSRKIISDLKSRTFDLIVSSLPFLHKNISQLALFEDEILVVMHPDHRLSTRSFITEKDFHNEVLISFADESSDGILKFFLIPAEICLKSFFTIDQPEGIIEMVRSGIGIAFLPKWSVKSLIDQGELAGKPFTQTGLNLHWNSLYLKDEHIPVYRQQFINMFPDFIPKNRSV